MEHLKCTVETGDEREFIMRTTHFLRPALKQIKDSLHEIKDYYEIKDGVCFVPKKLVSSFKKLKVKLLERLKKDSFLFEKNIIRGYDIKDCEHRRVLVFMTESLGPVLDVPLKPRPDNIMCDVFLAMPYQPFMVLTIVDGGICDGARTYNTHLTSSITHRLHRFNDEDVHLIHGVLIKEDIESDSMFRIKIEQCAKSSSFFFNLSSFSMDLAKYERILLSFWAAAAETNSVTPKKGEEEGSFLRFLTKEQCCVLVENIDQKDVEVRCGPGTGSTTLMVEVARRLSRRGSTLLVCQTKEEEKEISAVYQGNIAVQGSILDNPSEFFHVVDATNTAKKKKISGRLWRFIEDEKSRPYQAPPVQHHAGHTKSGSEPQATARKRLSGVALQCGKCSKYAKTTQGLAAHMRSHHVQDNVRDNMEDRNGKEMKEEVEHTGCKDRVIQEVAVKSGNPDLPKDSGPFTCAECKFSFPSEEKLKEHILKEKYLYRKARPHMESPGCCMSEEQKVNSPLTICCPKCTNKYKTDQEFNEHMKNVHDATRHCRVVEDHGLRSSYKVPGFSVKFTEEGETYLSRVESQKMSYSTTKVFKDLQVKREIDLVNFEKSGQHDDDQLKLLEGVCCDRLLLSPAPSNGIYLETHTKFQALTGWAGVAMGVCEEGTLDSHRLLSRQERTWCVCIGKCQTHKGSICTKVWEGPGIQMGECFVHTVLPKTPSKGSKSVVRLALVLDIQKGRIGFIDLDREEVLYKFDCDFKESLYPVFSISTTPEVSRRTMTLITGSDVVFTDTKKSLICDALSDF